MPTACIFQENSLVEEFGSYFALVLVWKVYGPWRQTVLAEKCLLYAMRLWGDSLETLHAAAGTVFNEVKTYLFLYPRVLLCDEIFGIWKQRWVR